MAAVTDEKFLFRMYKSAKTGFFHAVFKDLNGAFQIYTLLRITVAESELPNISYVGKEREALLVRGDKGRDEWGYTRNALCIQRTQR